MSALPTREQRRYRCAEYSEKGAAKYKLLRTHFKGRVGDLH